MKVSIAPQCPADAVVFEYGVRLDKECQDAAWDQLSAARRLYNELIACERLVVDQLRQFVIEQGGNAAASAQARVDQLCADFDAAKARNDEPAMKTIAQERRIVWRELAAILKDVRSRHRTEIQSGFLSRIGKNAGCETYAIRSNAVKEGLGWATANAVLDAALVAFKNSFALGRAPRFSRAADRTQECLTLQFTSAGGVTSADLLSGRHPELSIVPTEGCGRRKYGELKFRLGNAGANTYATGTWQYHRPLPNDSRVASARLVRKQIGKDQKWFLQLVVKLATPYRMTVGDRKPLVAIHFGWATDVEGRRVAAIADSADSGMARLVRLPPDIEDGLDRAAAIQSRRDTARDESVQKLKEIDPSALPESCREEVNAIRKLPAQHVAIGRLHRLRRLLQESGVSFDWLDRWRAADRIAWQSSAHIARRARLARRDYYRKLALELARNYSTITIEPLALAEAAKRVDDATGERSEFGAKARSGRVVAALYELDSAIRWAASKAECAILEVVGETVRTCAHCGGSTVDAEDGGSAVHCTHCGAVTDRKLNGAATAWFAAYGTLETTVPAYHFEVLAQMRRKGEATTERKAKLAAGRRAARTSS